MTLARLVLLLGPIAVAGACAKPNQAVLARLIESGEETESLDPRADFDLEPAWQQRLDQGADLSSWSFYVPTASATPAGPDGGIDLAPLGSSTYLVWTGRLATSGIDSLRFRFRQPLTNQAEFYWNGEGEDFAPQRYALQAPDPLDPRQVTFDLSSSAAWGGTVARIGLRLLDQPVPGQALEAAEGLRYQAPQTMGDGEARRVELEGRSIEAWLARPATTVRHKVTVPPGARLRFEAAAWLPSLGGVKVRVVAQRQHFRTVLAESELRDRVDSERHVWSDFEVDLAAMAGETIELLFESSPAPPGSLVAWGNPVVIGPAAERRPNVILVSLDTVRADHLSLYGYERETSPYLTAWAKRWATVFETTVASAPWTLPSHVAMLSGIDAVHHGVNRHGPIPPSMKLVQQRFSDAGYATFATTAGVLLTPQLGFARGFDDFRVRGKMESLPEWDTELSRGVTDALSWMSSHHGERFFLFFHTFEAHAPYQPREPYFSKFGGSQRDLNGGAPVWMEAAGFEALVRPKYLLFHPANYVGGITYPRRQLETKDRQLAATLYDSGLAHIDKELGRLWEYLEANDQMENTIVVVTSDHGESLYEHGLVGHSSLYDHDLLVPLAIAAPLDSARGLRVSAQVRSVDIAPSLLQLAGLFLPDSMDGSSLMPFLRGQGGTPRDAWSYALSTVRGVSRRMPQRHLKVIAQDSIFDPFRGALEVYDLSQDPDELRNLAPGLPAGTLRKGLVSAVAGGSASLQVQVANTGPHELTGILGGSGIDGDSTSGDLTFSCCESTALGVRFRVPAGRGFTFLLQDQPATGTLGLWLESADQTWSKALPLATIPSRMRVVWEAGAWHVDGRANPLDAWTGIEIRHQGSLERGRTDEAQFLKGLRALGYLR